MQAAGEAGVTDEQLAQAIKEAPAAPAAWYEPSAETDAEIAVISYRRLLVACDSALGMAAGLDEDLLMRAGATGAAQAVADHLGRTRDEAQRLDDRLLGQLEISRAQQVALEDQVRGEAG